MKIVSWNCAGGLRNKLSMLDRFAADVYIIQECENPAQSTAAYREWAGNYLWLGDNKNRGVGVFPKNGSSVQQLYWQGSYCMPGVGSSHSSGCWSTADLKLFLPFSLNSTYHIVAVWTKGNDQQAFGYIGQLWKYIQIHREELSLPNTMLIGDFNSNAIWDKKDRWWSHSGVVTELRELGLRSKYHAQTEEQQGSEKIPTFYMHRKPEKGYHIDYAFLTKPLVNQCDMRIGSPEEWLQHSDHMPLELALTEQAQTPA